MKDQELSQLKMKAGKIGKVPCDEGTSFKTSQGRNEDKIDESEGKNKIKNVTNLMYDVEETKKKHQQRMIQTPMKNEYKRSLRYTNSFNGY